MPRYYRCHADATLPRLRHDAIIAIVDITLLVSPPLRAAYFFSLLMPRCCYAAITLFSPDISPPFASMMPC